MVKEINITKDFQGYIWMSDQTKPEVFDFNNEKLLVLDDNKNPFVIEGQLYDKTQKKSYSIKYVDGKYIVMPYDVTDDEVKNAKSYYPNRMSKKLLFYQRWEVMKDNEGKENGDDYCENIPVLEPAGLVFVGFGEQVRKEEQ